MVRYSPWSKRRSPCVASSCHIAVSTGAWRMTSSVSSLPILEKGEQFLRVIGILTLLCSHYKIGLLRKLSLIKFYKYAIIVATMYIDTSHITRNDKTYTRHLLR